jgi:hypothetical protein
MQDPVAAPADPAVLAVDRPIPFPRRFGPAACPCGRVRDDRARLAGKIGDRGRVAAKRAPAWVERSCVGMRGLQPEQPSDLVEVVNRHVEQHRLLEIEPVAGERGRPEEADEDRLDAADRAVGDEPLDGARAAREAEVLADHRDAAGSCRRVRDRGPVFERPRQRLLDQAVESCRERFLGDGAMCRGWNGDQRRIRRDRGDRLAQCVETPPGRHPGGRCNSVQRSVIEIDEGGQVPVGRRAHDVRPTRAPRSRADLDEPQPVHGP